MSSIKSNRRGVLMSVCVLVGGMVNEAPADFKTWVAPGGTRPWSLPFNWSPMGVPASTDVAFLTQSDGFNRTASYNSTPAGNAAALVRINATGTGAMTLEQTAGTFNVATVFAADNGTGFFNRTGGSASIGTLVLGSSASGDGTVNMSGGTLTVATRFQIGNGGAGTFSQTGGVINVTTTPLSMGEFAGATGNLFLNDGSFTAATLLVGNAGVGHVKQRVLSTVNITSLKVGNSVGSSGTYEMTGDGLIELNVGSIEVGVNGTGRFIVADPIVAEGSLHCASSLYLGSGPTGQGQFDMFFGTVEVEGSIFVGGNGQGTFVHADGNVLVANSVRIGAGGATTSAATHSTCSTQARSTC